MNNLIFMKKLITIFIFFAVLFGGMQSSFASIKFWEMAWGVTNPNDRWKQEPLSKTKNALIGTMKDANHVNTAGEGWVKWLQNTLFRIAKDMKTLIFIFASLFLAIMVLILLIGDKPEEQQEKLKNGIIWVSLGIMMMQIAFIVHDVFFNKNIDRLLGETAKEIILEPILQMLMFFASFVFVAMGVWSFYLLVTASGDEDKVTKGKMIIVQAVIGFVVIKFSQVLVKNTFDPCTETYLWFLRNDQAHKMCNDITKNAGIITTIITWVNGFIALVIVLMILYAGFLIILKKWDEDAYKKAKSILLYSWVGVIILFGSYIILNFFIGQ